MKLSNVLTEFDAAKFNDRFLTYLNSPAHDEI